MLQQETVTEEKGNLFGQQKWLSIVFQGAAASRSNPVVAEREIDADFVLPSDVCT